MARFHSAPKETHVRAVKRILKYIKGTMESDLWHLKGQDFTLKAYTDVDWAVNIDDKKCTSGGALFMGNYLVSLLSKNQS